MIIEWLTDGTTYIEHGANLHEAKKAPRIPVILNFSNCNSRYSEVPETMKIIPNKKKNLHYWVIVL